MCVFVCLCVCVCVCERERARARARASERARARAREKEREREREREVYSQQQSRICVLEIGGTGDFSKGESKVIYHAREGVCAHTYAHTLRESERLRGKERNILTRSGVSERD